MYCGVPGVLCYLLYYLPAVVVVLVVVQHYYVIKEFPLLTVTIFVGETLRSSMR
jgi:hypothetical protein